MEVIRKGFSPEFRNRLDAIIHFDALEKSTILRVVDKFLFELESQLADKHVSLHVDEPARAWLADKGFDPLMGARPMARVIQEHIKRKLADELLFGALVGGGKVTVTLGDGDSLGVVSESQTAEPADAEVA